MWELENSHFAKRNGGLPSLNAVFDGVAHEFVLTVEVQLGQDVAHVVFDRLLGNEELFADLAVGVAASHMGPVSYTHLTLPTTPYV